VWIQYRFSDFSFSSPFWVKNTWRIRLHTTHQRKTLREFTIHALAMVLCKIQAFLIKQCVPYYILQCERYFNFQESASLREFMAMVLCTILTAKHRVDGILFCETVFTAIVS